MATDFSLYNIEPQEFRILDRHDDGMSITYELEPVKEPEICLTCGFNTLIKHGRTERRVRDLSEHARKVGLIIYSHRYFCQNCHSTLTPQYRSIDDRAKMTNRMRDHIRRESLCVTFSQISKELDISVPTVKKIFDDYATELDAGRHMVAPRVLGMDEITSSASTGAYIST